MSRIFAIFIVGLSLGACSEDGTDHKEGNDTGNTGGDSADDVGEGGEGTDTADAGPDGGDADMGDFGQGTPPKPIVGFTETFFGGWFGPAIARVAVGSSGQVYLGGSYDATLKLGCPDVALPMGLELAEHDYLSTVAVGPEGRFYVPWWDQNADGLFLKISGLSSLAEPLSDLGLKTWAPDTPYYTVRSANIHMAPSGDLTVLSTMGGSLLPDAFLQTLKATF